MVLISGDTHTHIPRWCCMDDDDDDNYYNNDDDDLAWMMFVLNVHSIRSLLYMKIKLSTAYYYQSGTTTA